jgi:hypothetical protein
MTPLQVQIDLSVLKTQFGLASQKVDELTENVVNKVTKEIYRNWEALAKKNLHSSLPEYLQNLHIVDKGRFDKQIVLTGVLSNMIEQGASAFDMKEGFKKSTKVKFSIPVYNAKGKQVYEGGDWYLTIPFRQGTPGIVGQGGFANEMPEEVHQEVMSLESGESLPQSSVPTPFDVPQSRAAIVNESGVTQYDEYVHKSSIYAGIQKQTASYDKANQNSYVSFRRAGANSDPLSWIHRGLKAAKLAEQAKEKTDVRLITRNEILQFLDTIL